ncbi:Uncharacterised protein [Mycobacteroides abscessus subsp. abscessus]|nr:Uncharacterised protein [Mycobacteroides abscessus subsp. abscessus]
MVDFARVARLDDERDLRALLGADEMVMHRRRRQQRRNRRVLTVGVPVRHDERAVALRDRLAGAASKIFERIGEALPAAGHLIESVEDLRGESRVVAVIVDVDELGEVVVVDDRPVQHDLSTRRRGRGEQVLLGSHHTRHRGDDFLADRIEWRVGDLRE